MFIFIGNDFNIINKKNWEGKKVAKSDTNEIKSTNDEVPQKSWEISNFFFNDTNKGERPQVKISLRSKIDDHVTFTLSFTYTFFLLCYVE